MDINQLRQKLPHLAQLDDAHLIDVVQRIYYPKVDKAVLAERLGVKFEAPMPEEPGLLRSVGDSGVALGRGLVSGVKMVSDAFGADNAVSEALGGARDSLSTLESDYRKAERQRRAQRIKEADESGSTWESIKANLGALYEAPLDTLLEAAGTMAPTLAMAAIPGLGQANLARTVATAGMGAVQGAGVVKGEIYEAVERRLLEAGVPPEEAAARAAEAQAYDGPNQANIAAGAGLGAAAGSTGIERIIGRGGATGGLAGRVAAGTVAEGIPEAVQGGQERYASNVALQREGFDVPTWQGVAGQAALEGAAGGLLGGGVSAFSSAPVEPAPNDGPLTRAVKAGGQDPAAPVVPPVVDVPADQGLGLPAAGLTEEQEAAALSRMEAQAQSDLQGLRDFTGRATPEVARRRVPAKRQTPPQPGEEGSAQFVPDAAFSDRVLALREQLADERVREQVRERFGDDALNEITYYTSLADRPDVDLPDLTRSRLLELAERGVGEALLRPIQSRPNVGANQRPEQIGATPGVPQIGLDTAPTGTIRVDGAGRAAPETRADQISTRQGQNEAAAERQRRDELGLTPDVEAAQARMVRPGDTLNPSGEPFKTRMAADRAAKKDGGAVVPVEGGFVVRKEQANDVAMGAGRGPGGSRAAGGADAGRGVGADGRPAAEPRGAVPGRVPADAAPAAAGGARPAGDDAALTEEALTARYDAAKEAGDSQGMMAAARELSALRRRAQEPQTRDVQDAPTRARKPKTQAPAGQARAAVEGDAARAAGPSDAGAPAVQADGVEVTRKGGEPFATKMAAQREVNKRGLSDSHEVVPVTGGFIARAKTRAVDEPQGSGPTRAGDESTVTPQQPEEATPEAVGTHKDPGEPAAPAPGPENPNRTLSRAEYEAAVRERTVEFAVGLVGDNVPMSFQQRKMAAARIPDRLKSRFDIVATGSGASRRYWVVPTYTEYLRRRGETEPAAPAQPAADSATTDAQPADVSAAAPAQQAEPTPLEKRNIWIPKMTPRRLDALLAKPERTADDIEDLKDFRHFLLTDQQSAIEKGFYEQYLATGGSVPVLKNKFWLTNINAAIAEGPSQKVAPSPARAKTPIARLQDEIGRAERKLENLKEQARKARAAVNFAKADEINEKILILQSEIKGMQAELEAMQAAGGADPAGGATAPAATQAEQAPDDLALRHAAIDAQLDAMSDEQVREVYRRANLAGERRPVEQLRATLKQEHPDDIEPLLDASDPQREDAASAAGGADVNLSIDDGAPQADTGAYVPASPEHQQLADTLGERLSRSYGRAIVLDAVAPGSGAVGGRGRELAAVSTVARRLFGHEVVFVRFKGKPLFNGAMSTAIPDVLFLNADSKKPLMAVLGHELLHHLQRTNPSIYNTLNNRLNRLKKNERDYLHKLEVLYGRQGAKAPANWDEELNADIVGDFFMDPEFWAAMAKDQPGLFRRVANAIIKFLDDVAAKIADIRPFGTDQYLTEIAAARAAVVDAMRQFSGAQVGAMTSQSEGINLSVAGLPDTITVDGKQRPTRNSAGQPIHPTEEGIRNFWRWFSGSKVVDANGKPLVVYRSNAVDSVLSGKAQIPEGGMDGLRGNAELVSNLLKSPTFRLEGLGGFDAPTQRVVLAAVRSFGLDPKILRSVVELVPVDMVNILAGKNLSSESLFSNDAVLKELLSANRDGSVSSAVDVADALVSAVAGVTAKATSVSVDGVGSLLDGSPASGAGEVNVFLSTHGGKLQAVDATMVQQRSNNTGNRGTFDPNDARINFSIADDSLAHPVDSWKAKGPQAAREFIEDTLTSQRGFNRWWHRTIGTQFHKSRINPYFRRTYEAVQRYLQDTSRMANAAADEAPDLLLRIESLSDLKKMNPKDADLKAAGEAIFGGTLVDEKVYTDAELKAKGLTDKQIGYYRQFRAAVDRSLDHLVATDVIRLMTTQDLQYLGRTKGEADANLDALKELAVEEPGAVRGRLEKLILDRIAEIQAGIDGQPNQHTPGLIDKRQAAQTLLGDVREKFNRIQQLKEEGYAPLMRFGQYTVDVVDAEGERIYFGMYESQREANKAAREFRAMEGVTVRQGVQSQKEFEALKGLSPETVMLFAEMTGMEKNEAMQAWLKEAVAQQSALKRYIKRKGIAGFSPDLQRVLAAFVTSNARAASQNLHNLEVAESVESIPQSLGDVKDEALKLAQYVQNPQEEAQTIRSLMFVNYIGGSVASAMVNLSQTLVQTFPYLAQFGGAGKAAARITAAMKDAATRRVSDPDLRDAIARAEKDGVIRPQEIFQLQAEASRNFGSNPWVRKILTVWGSMFQLAEQFNRRTAFIAAYLTAQEQGIANPFEFAENAVAETQSVFNKGNRPNWARGAVGATLFTFKTFSIQYVEFLKRLPPKERALALAILVVAAGSQGLPFAEDLQDVLDSIAQGMGYQFSTKQAMNAMVARTLGQGAADFLQHGFSTLPGVPLDVSARLGLGNLLPGTGVLKASETRKEDEVLETFGVVGSFVRDALKGEVRPIALRNAAKALDMYQTGMYRNSRDYKVADVDAVDAVLKGLGLQPAGVARESRAAQAQYEAQAQYDAVSKRIREDWAKGLFEGDAQRVQDARNRLADWNSKNPEMPIRVNMPGILKRVREMRKPRAQRMEESAPRHLRPAVRETLQ